MSNIFAPFPDWPFIDTALRTSPETDTSSQTNLINPSLSSEPGPWRIAWASHLSNWYDDYDTSSKPTLSSCSILTYFLDVKHECWQKAINEELQVLQDNYTWDVVSRPSMVKAIGCKLVFSVKLRSDETLHRFKERLVASGIKKECEVDNKETFAPVTKITTICIVISIADSLGWSFYFMLISKKKITSLLLQVYFLLHIPLCVS